MAATRTLFGTPSASTGAPAALPVTTQTANYTATSADGVILANGAGITITLPAATTAGTGTNFWVKNLNASAATLASNGGTIDGSTTASLPQWQSLTVVSDGSNWYVI